MPKLNCAHADACACVMQVIPHAGKGHCTLFSVIYLCDSLQPDYQIKFVHLVEDVHIIIYIQPDGNTIWPNELGQGKNVYRNFTQTWSADLFSHHLNRSELTCLNWGRCANNQFEDSWSWSINISYTTCPPTWPGKFPFPLHLLHLHWPNRQHPHRHGAMWVDQSLGLVGTR